MNVAVMSGRSPLGEGKLFSARVVGLEKCKQFLPVRVSVSRGQDISRVTRSRPWMMTGNQSFQVLDRVKETTAATRSMSSDMRRGK